MRVSFKVACPPFSINAFHYATKRIITADAREWMQDVIYQLSAPGIEAKLQQFRKEFDQKKDTIALILHFKFPESQFYTKAGHISSHIPDLSNIEKPLMDILFLPKHFGNNPPQTFQNLNMDDKFVTTLYSKKSAFTGEKPHIEISLKILKGKGESVK